MIDEDLLLLARLYRREPTEEEKKEHQEWVDSWVGRKFRCTETGEEFTIPDTVYPTAFYSFGNCFVDVGRKGYSRFGGYVVEITGENDE